MNPIKNIMSLSINYMIYMNCFTDFNNVLTNMMRLTNANVHALQVHHETYVSQIKDALNVNGGDIENATGMDYVLHFLTFGWKVF